MKAAKVMRRAMIATAMASLSLAASAHAAVSIEVTSATDDNAGCTLREAITSANGETTATGCTITGSYDNGLDEITFNIPGLIDTITLAEAPLTITSDMNIVGSGVNTLTINGNGGSYTTLAQSSGTATMSNLSITGGVGEFIATGQFGGGGIYKTAGTLTLNSVRVHNNTIFLASASVPVTVSGGGIYNASGSLTVNDSIIEDNKATADLGTTGTGDAIAHGGGIASLGPLFVNRSTIDDNDAEAGRNAGNDVTGEGEADGGGIYSTSTMDIDRSTISNNRTLAYANNALANLRTHAGGISKSAGAGSIELSTVAGNRTAVLCGCAPPVPEDHSGGIQTRSTATLTIVSSTIADNGPEDGTATSGKNISQGDTSTISFRNTIVADPVTGGANCSGLAANLTSLGHNIEYSTTPGGTCDVTPAVTDLFVDPDLQPLTALNGGPTATMALLSTSPAVDAGTVAGQVTDPGVDQRGAGFPRPLDHPSKPNVADGSDIGAFEAALPPVTPPPPAPPAGGPTGLRAAALQKCKKKKGKKRKKCKKKALQLPV